MPPLPPADPAASGFDDVERLLTASLAGRAASATAAAVDAAIERSRALTGLRRAATPVRTAPLPYRLRLIGAATLAFVAAHLLLLQLVSIRVAPAMPWIVWVTAALAGAVLLLGGDALAVAWQAKRRRQSSAL